jgi:hypothetical protein
LPDDLGINPIPKLLCAKRPARIGVDDQITLLQSTPAAQVAAIPFENEVDLLLADDIRCGLGRFLYPPVDGNECGIDEARMDWRFISAHPEHIRKREVLETGRFVE